MPSIWSTALRDEGVDAFPIQADVTNMGDLWAMRSYVIEQMGGLPPNLAHLQFRADRKGLSVRARARELPDEQLAMRRARVRQHFIDNLEQSRIVLDTKIDGFLAMTHLWAGEAVYHEESLQIVYVSSRMAIDPGPTVPGYVDQQLGGAATARKCWRSISGAMPKLVSATLRPAAVYPHRDDRGVRRTMPHVFGRWQPRMLETA